MRWRKVVLGVLAVVLMLAGWLAVGLTDSRKAAAQTAAATAPGAAEVRRGRWEALPEGVWNVFLGPDQRRWFVQTPGEGAVDVEKVKACVAGEWGKASPMLVDCWPVLFEKSGAVWVVTRDRRTLLRYDGAGWIEHAAHSPPEVPGGFVGICPGHGITIYHVHNLEAAGACFFVESTGVSVFDGTNWTFQGFTTGAKTAFADPMALLAERDGQGALLLELRQKALWRYRGGKWKRLALPALAKEGIAGAALAPDGNLWVTSFANPRVQIVVVPLDGRKADPAATQAEAAPLVIGGMNVNRYTCELGQDEQGDIFVSVMGIPPEAVKERSGLLVVGKDGKAPFYPGVYLNMSYGNGLVADGGKSVWVNTGIYDGDRWAKRIDLSAGPPFEEKQLAAGFRFVQAVAADGTVYVAPDDPLEALRHGVPMRSMMAYKPGEVDERQVVSPVVFEMASSTAVVANDGAVWAAMPEKGVCRFDGKEWKTMFRPNGSWMTLIPGSGSSMLWWVSANGANNPETFGLVLGKKQWEGNDLWALVKEQAEGFATALRGTSDPEMWRPTQQRFTFPPHGATADGGWSVAVDKELRLWVTIDRELKVLDAKGEWMALKWPDPKAKKVRIEGSRAWPGIGPTRVIPIGDGSAMYVSDTKMGERDTAYVVRLENGAAKWTDAPSPGEGIWRGPDGALWVVFKRAAEGQRADSSKARIVLARVDASGVTKEFILPAAPVFLDNSGYLWLAGMDENKICGGDFLLWKEGEVAGQVHVPGVWAGRKVVSDREGSVWVWTSLGLHHLVADDLRHPTRYRIKSVSVIEAEGREAFDLFYTSTALSFCDQGLMIESNVKPPRGNTQFRVQFLPVQGR